MALVDTVMTEIKAAAIDVVAEAAEARGLDLVFVDNIPQEVAPAQEGALAQVVDALADLAQRTIQGSEVDA